MKTRYRNIIFIFLILWSFDVNAQKDIQPPLAPVLKLVSIEPETGYADMQWTISASPDVAGYVIYAFHNNEGYAFDTIWDPSATSFIHTGSASSYYTESYVIAALDSSSNISPLSNGINTIFSSSTIDTCRKKIEIHWNSYPDFPNNVAGYKIMVSVNGNNLVQIANVDRFANTYTLTDFETDSHYCFVIRADIEGSLVSSSNKTCIDTKMQRPPLWINADYTKVTENKKIALSFSYDPLSGINNFTIERKKGLNGTFTTVTNIYSHSNPILFTDESESSDQVYYYRLSAINNCSTPVAVSNLACNILPVLETDGKEIRLSWNKYRDWNGNILNYSIFYNTNGSYEEFAETVSTDTSYVFQYRDIMYNISENQVCFYIKAKESANPFVTNAESKSSVVCTDIIETITVPNAFTPDNNLVNDYFRPVLSFTPKDYHLLIRDRHGYVVFETRDYLSEWDGHKNGKLLPSDAYLWFLRLTAPSGKVYTKTGTVTIIDK
jgi:gliding motility-associated-like protein